MLYFFMFKAIASIVLYYGFALGKSFNPAIWNNRYDKTKIIIALRFALNFNGNIISVIAIVIAM